MKITKKIATIMIITLLSAIFIGYKIIIHRLDYSTSQTHSAVLDIDFPIPASYVGASYDYYPKFGGSLGLYWEIGKKCKIVEQFIYKNYGDAKVISEFINKNQARWNEGRSDISPAHPNSQTSSRAYEGEAAYRTSGDFAYKLAFLKTSSQSEFPEGYSLSLCEVV